MNLSEVDRELEREPTLYYWEVPGVAAGYEKFKSDCNYRKFTFVMMNDIALTAPKMEEPNV